MRSSRTRSYAALYAETIDFCREHGAFDPATMGTTPNVGLMAQKAEEYGSHDKTFEIAAAGHRARGRRRRRRAARARRRGRATSGARARPRTRRSRDWVKLAVERARATGCAGRLLARRDPRARRPGHREGPRVPGRPRHRRPPDRDPAGAPRRRASRSSAPRAGEDTISVTGNVLRDYLTDLFPILELGTSAKMLSIVPLMNGGGLFETGAGGSAPKHVQQLVQENHLRWDSLGEFLALAVSLEMLADKTDNARAKTARAARSTRPPASCWRTAGRRRARSASSTTAAATSTSRSTGRRRWPSRGRRRSRALAAAARRRRGAGSSASSTASRASRWSSAATTTPTATRPTR